MSATLIAHDARRVEAFYQRWSSDVFVFCRLFLGDEREAERMVSRAFLDFYRESSVLPLGDGLPAHLIGFAYRAMQPCRPVPAQSLGGSLEKCLAYLDSRQRAVFIARNVLGVAWPSVAVATGLVIEEVKKLWLAGMLKVRDLLPRDFFNR